MKNVKRLIAAILCAATFLTVCVPFASAEENSESAPANPQASQADSQGQDVDLPGEEPEHNDEIIGEKTTEPEEEFSEPEKEESYAERLGYFFNEGLENMRYGVVFIASFLISPLLFVIPPIGAVALVGGLPMGLFSLIVGLGEVVASPVLAFFADTDTSLLF